MTNVTGAEENLEHKIICCTLGTQRAEGQREYYSSMMPIRNWLYCGISILPKPALMGTSKILKRAITFKSDALVSVWILGRGK